MRLAFTATVLSAIAVVAQDLSNLPDCGLKCILDAIPLTGCAEATDFSCVCKAADKLTTPVQVCAGKTCSVPDFESLPAALMKFCAAAGVKITVDSALPSTATLPLASESSPATAPATTSASASITSSVPTASGSVAADSSPSSTTSTPDLSENGPSKSIPPAFAPTTTTPASNGLQQLPFARIQVFLILHAALVVSLVAF